MHRAMMQRFLLLVTLGSLLSTAACLEEEPVPVPARLQWNLTLNGQPATCADLYITTVTISVQGPGQGFCRPKENFWDDADCVSQTYEVPCTDGAFERIFESSIDSALYNVRATFQTPANRSKYYLGEQRLALHHGGDFNFDLGRAALDVSWSLPRPPSSPKLALVYSEVVDGVPVTQSGTHRLIVTPGVVDQVSLLSLPSSADDASEVLAKSSGPVSGESRAVTLTAAAPSR
jgi:hypothetical protein